MHFIQQSIVGFDVFMKVQAGRAHGTLMFCGDQSKVSILTCALASFHFKCNSSRRKHAQCARWHPEELA